MSEPEYISKWMLKAIRKIESVPSIAKFCGTAFSSTYLKMYRATNFLIVFVLGELIFEVVNYALATSVTWFFAYTIGYAIFIFWLWLMTVGQLGWLWGFRARHQ